MARFCGNCGRPMEPDARVCGQCGTPAMDLDVGGGLMVQPGGYGGYGTAGRAATGGYGGGPTGVAAGGYDGRGTGGYSVRPRINTKLVNTLICCLLVAAFLGGGVWAFINFTGPKGLVRMAMSAFKDGDVDALLDMSCDFYYEEDLVDRLERNYENKIDNALDYFDNNVGHNYKLSYEIREFYTLSERKMDKLYDEIEYISSSIDTDEIKEARTAEIRLRATQGKKSKFIEYEVRVVKDGSGWSLLDIDTN